MKKFRKYFISFICIVSVVSCFSCCSAAKKQEVVTPVVEEPVIIECTKEYSPVAENVKQIGRSYEYCDILWMGYSSTGAAFNVKANALEVEIISNGSVPSEDSRARVVVFVNNERMADKMIDDSLVTIPVFASNKTVEGEVRVLKVSEASSSWAGICSIKVDENGTISPAAEKDLKIEFIGDSITCGYGIDDEDRNHHFKTSTEDNTKTYAYKTAEALNADYSMVSVSGSGVISGYTGDGKRNKSALVPAFYSGIGFSWGRDTFEDQVPQKINWDFTKFVPDVVVVNLGTNDNSYTKSDSSKCEEFENEYVSFLSDIRSKNPDAYIVCTLGLMGKELLPSIKNAVSRMNDEKIDWVELNSTSSYGYAADWHPTEAGNAKAAEILTGKIKSLLKIK